MARVRYTITATLVVVTPLHVGSGETRTVAKVRGKEGIGNNARGAPEVAAIARGEDASGNLVPYIPGSTLKGALRRLAETLPELAPHVGRLFGAAKSETEGVMGAVMFRGALMSKAGFSRMSPYADRDGPADLGEGVFVAARTSIDGASGTADDGRLYFQEMVAPESEFALRFVIEGGDEAATKATAEQMLALLNYIEREGLQLGKSTADGNGLVKVKGANTTCRKEQIDAGKGAFVAVPANDVAAPAVTISRPSAAWSKVLTLHCRTPFIVVDSSHEAKKDPITGEPQGPQLKAQRVARNLPLLLGSGASGALRSRAEWLQALAVMRACGATRETTDIIVRGPDDITKLDCVQRLFGVTGFKGLLAIGSLVFDPKPELMTITSVKLDRFSGAPIDGALFQCEAFEGVTIKLALELIGRRDASNPSQFIEPTADDKEFADRLLQDLKDNGLELGHGGNKGFGWLEVREQANAGA